MIQRYIDRISVDNDNIKQKSKKNDCISLGFFIFFFLKIHVIVRINIF